MRWTSLLVSGGLAFLLVIAGVFGTGAMAAGPVAELEPNDTCETAQDLGALEGSLTVAGELAGRSPYPEPGAEAPNVDFFRITAAPGTEVELLMRGASSGGGSLENPFLGIFGVNENGCWQLYSDNYGGSGFDVRLVTVVGESGALIVGASSCCDYPLTMGGFGGGSYTLRLSVLERADSINGTVVDSESGEPPAQMGVLLARCEEGGCTPIENTATDQFGRFSFADYSAPVPPYPGPDDGPYSTSPSRLALYAGDYQLTFTADNYLPLTTAIFSLAPGQQLNLGSFALTQRKPIGPIQGQLIDSKTGEPVAGSYVELLRCDEFYGCMNLLATGSDADGRFTLDPQSYYAPLYEGEYQLAVTNFGYESFSSGPIQLTSAGYDFGAIQIRPTPQIGSISGRLVDAVSGEPLPGTTEPYGRVNLLRLNDYGYYDYVGYSPVDAEGRFSFSSPGEYDYIRPGTFAIFYQASQYVEAQSEPFAVAEDEVKELGDIAVQPFPIRLLSGANCAQIPAAGGQCRYSVWLVNGQAAEQTVQAWSTLTVYPNAYRLFGPNTFQPQPAERVRLGPGQSKEVRFSVQVPGTIPGGTIACAQIHVAEDERGFYFQPLLNRTSLCFVKEYDGSFRVMDAEEGRALLQRRGAPEGSRNIR